MTEPVSSLGTAISAGTAGSALITVPHSQLDPKLVVRVVCGTCVFMMRAQQSVRYIEIAEKTPSQQAFEYG